MYWLMGCPQLLCQSVTELYPLNPEVTLLTPASALLLPARTDTGLDSFPRPCVTP